MGRSDNSHKIFPGIFLRIELFAINKGGYSPTWDSGGYNRGMGWHWCMPGMSSVLN